MQDKEERALPFYYFARLNKFTLNIIFVPALLLMLFISIYLYYQIDHLIKANHWVVHTQEVIQTTDSILYEMVAVESNQRGFLITNNDEYINEIEQAKDNLEKKLNRLQQLTQDNPEQAARTTKFIKLIEQRLTMLSAVAKLKMENKFGSVDGLTQFNRSQEISSRVKGQGQEIISVESVLLKERNEAALERANSAIAIMLIVCSISILALFMAFILVNSELSIRKKMESKNKKSRIQLRSIIESASDMIAAFDKENKFIIFNQPYHREFKYLFNKSITLGMPLDEALKDVPEDKNELKLLWANSLTTNESKKQIEFNENNEHFVYEMIINDIQNDDNETDGSVQIIRDISKRVHEHSELQKSYESLGVGMKKLQEKNHQITLLVEMSDIMLACSSQEELSNVMIKYTSRMLQFADGCLYVMHPSKNYLEIIAQWGDATRQLITFTPEQCWAIRRGRIHQVNTDHEELICDHVTEPKPSEIMICVPLMAQNDIYGMLYLELQPEETINLEDHKLLINAFSELTALALANVRLRENLRYQSIRDPLTGLYNRRYLEDYMFKQIHQADRSKSVLSVMMMDLDHFKKLNDTYGHDAGDAALKEFGKVIMSDIRISDLAARFGGEEFIVVLYDTDADSARIRAEHIRNAVSMIQIRYGAQIVGPITVSIGISEYPKEGQTIETLIENADRALYFAKNNGRNRVVLYSELNIDLQVKPADK
ncbi:diguanylate cyclase [uncultured Legionella sp.]|uniref:diguanylate cyclase n=1 Tax=uncultured Legionella sp. TaxID=210934 RepID=UPI002615A1EF|nr:diguanylate cyclase [uncultured Legionella sp.]